MKAFSVNYVTVFSVQTRIVIAPSREEAKSIIEKEHRGSTIQCITETDLRSTPISLLTVGDLMRLGVINFDV